MANPPANRRPGVDANLFQGQWIRGYDVPAGNDDPAADPCDLIVSNGKSQIDQTVSNLIFASRKDTSAQPIFVMEQGEDVLSPIGRVNFHIGRDADPNGLITTSVSGSLYSSWGSPSLWQLQGDGITWVQISDNLGGEDLQQTLAIGNTTGGLNIVLTSGDFLKGQDNAAGNGFTASIAGGDATGAVGNGGAVLIQGGTSVGGVTGAVNLKTLTATTPSGSGAIEIRTGDSILGGSSGGFTFTVGESGGVGVAGNGGSVFFSAGRSKATVGVPSGGQMQIAAGQATSSGRGGSLLFSAGASSNSTVFPPVLFPIPGLGGSIFLLAGGSSQAQPGGDINLTAGGGGPAGATGGSIVLTPGGGGGGFDDGEVIASGVFRADNIKRGNGDPNGLVAGNEGDVYQRLDAGVGQLWLNTNGSSSGWVRLAFAGDFINSFEQLQWGYLVPAAKNPTGAPVDEYADVGLWKGLTLSLTGGSTVTTGTALVNGPVLSFTTSGGAFNRRAALDMSVGVGNLPHAMENKFAALFQAKNREDVDFRAFLGFSTVDATNQLAATNAAPGGGTRYLGFVAEPDQHANWRVITRNGISTSDPFDTGVSIASTQASANSWFFLIDASLYPSSVQFFIFDDTLTLKGSVTVTTTLPSASVPLGLIVGIQNLNVAAPKTLYLNHATLVNQKGVVGEGGGSGASGLTLAQVLINGNETGTTLIAINQGSGIQGVVDDNAGDGASFLISSGATTLATNDTGNLTVVSGSASGGGAENPGSTTGYLFLSTGFQFGATSQGDTGNLSIQSGNHVGTDGTTGDLVLGTGSFLNGAAGVRTQGDILIAPGSFLPNTATVTGEVIIKGGSSSLTSVTGGAVTIMSGENSSAIGDTGPIDIVTFDVNLDGNSGELQIATGEGGNVSGNSGNILIQTGTAPAGTTGSMTLRTSNAGNGTGGSVLIYVGTTTSGSGSSMFLFGGDTSDALGTGGNIFLNPGTGTAGDGAVVVNGKLTVTGLIDPTGLLLSGQAVQPVAVGGGEGLLYVDNNVVPSKLFFVDDAGTPHDISTGGGVTTLGALTDVTLAAPAPGEVLTYNGFVWVNLAGAGGSPLSTILGIGNTTGGTAGGITISGSLGDRIAADDDLVLDPAVAAGKAVVIDGLRWPESDGTAGFVLTTNGLGQLSFQPGGGGGGTETFAEAFARMQWGSLIAGLAGAPPFFNFNGIFSVPPLELTPGPASTATTAEGVVATYTTAGGGPGSDAGVYQVSSALILPSRFLSVVHFNCSIPLGPPLDLRMFAGLTDLPPILVLSEPPVPGSYVGIQLITDAAPPQAVFNFVTQGGAAPTRVPTGISPAASPGGFWLTVDAGTPGQITLTLYDSNRVQLAQHTFVANLPPPFALLSHMAVIESWDAAPKTIDIWEIGTVTRADLLQTLGGGGTQNLASVLGFGSETGGLPIQGDDNLIGSGASLDFLGGSSSGGGGDGGDVNVTTGSPDPGGNGASGDLNLSTPAGAGIGASGDLAFSTGLGGALGGNAGNFKANLGNGPGGASGTGGGFLFAAGDGGGTGGAGGGCTIVTGSAVAGNNVGGSFSLTTGNGAGTSNGGDLSLQGGDGGAGGGDGGSLLFTVGAGMGGGVDGSISFTGDTTITGKLTVTGLIDPTGLLLDAQAVVPFVPAGSDGGIWVNNAGELIFTNTMGDLNLSTAIGGGMSWLDAILTAGYGFLGAGNPLVGPQSYGVYGSSINSAVSPGPPPASMTHGQDSEGPFLNLAVGADPVSQAFLGTSIRQIQRDSLFKARFKFQVTSPAHTDERIFIGFTDDLTLVTPNPMLLLDHPIPGIQYVGIAQSLAGFNLEFVAQGSGGAMAAVFAIPTDAAAHYLEIDATSGAGNLTFNLYASDGVTVEATHTELASFLIPDLANPLRPFLGIHTALGTTPRSLDFYDTTIVTRADVVDAITGGGMGGAPTLTMVLASGNDAGGIPILADGGITGGAVDLQLDGGAAGGAGAAGAIILETETGDNGGFARITAGNGAGAAGAGGPTTLKSGDGSGTGAGGSSFVLGGTGGGVGGAGGAVVISGGDALAGNAAGGVITLTTGDGRGTSPGALLSLLGGDGGLGGGVGDGGRVLIQAGSPLGAGDEGGINILAGSAVAPTTGEGAVQFAGSPFGGDANTESWMYLARADAVNGGNAKVQAGSAPIGGGGAGGSISLNTLAGDGAGDNGSIYLLGVNAVALSSLNPGGAVQLVGATVVGFSKGASLLIEGGGPLAPGMFAGDGGSAELGSGLTGAAATLTGGSGDGVASGGDARLVGGSGGATGDGGDAQILGGAATGAINVGGDVRVTPGVGPGGPGAIKIEGPIDPAVAIAPGIQPGIQFGTFPVGGLGPVVAILFNAGGFSAPPSVVQFSLESGAPVPGREIVIGGILPGSFIIITTIAPFGPGEIIHWVAFA